jgi:hypothetical protein
MIHVVLNRSPPQGLDMPFAPLLRSFMLCSLVVLSALALANTLEQALHYIDRLFTHLHRPQDWQHTQHFLGAHASYLPALLCLLLMIGAEWLRRTHKHALEAPAFGRPARWAVYIGLVLLIVFVGDHAEQRFIYFQF